MTRAEPAWRRQTHRPAGRLRRSLARMTTSDLCTRWLAEYAGPSPLSPSSVRQYELAIRRHVVPVLGAIAVESLTRADVQRLHLARADRPSAANQAVATLRQILDWAIGQGLRESPNPAHRAVRPYPRPWRTRTITPDEARALIIASARLLACGDLTISQQGCIELILLTGLRRGEAQGLRWADIDWARGLLILTSHKTARISGPKTIRMSEGTLALLRTLPRDDPAWVFPGRDRGRPIADLWRAWRRVADKAGLAGVVPHDARRGWASTALDTGTDLRVVAEQLGHASLATTAKYARVGDRLARDAAQRVEAEIRGRKCG